MVGGRGEKGAKDDGDELVSVNLAVLDGRLDDGEEFSRV